MSTIANSLKSATASNTKELSTPKIMLLLEGLAYMVGATIIYFNQGFGLTTFLVLFLLPDLAIAAYLVNRQVGAAVYNAVHFAALPVTLIVAGIVGDWTMGLQIGLIWAAHVGMDRAIGAGLKYTDGFTSTHLHRV